MLKYFMIAISLIFIIYNLVLVGYMNSSLARYWEVGNNGSVAIDKIAKRNAFNKIPEKSIVLTDNVMTWIHYPHYWQQYVKARTNKEFDFYKNDKKLINAIKDNNEIDIYYLSLNFSKINNDMLIVLSKIDESSMEIDTVHHTVKNLWSNDVDIYYYSSFKKFNLNFYSQPTLLNEATYRINDSSPQKLTAGYNQTYIQYKGEETDGITAFNITSSGFLDIEKFSISTMGFLGKEPQIVLE